MEIYLVRHGLAVERGSKGIASDAERPLTEEGIRRMRVQARGLAALECRAKTVLTSPLVRAVQTAELVRAALGEGAEVVETPALKPAARPEGALRLIAEREEPALVLVGHEPFLSEFTSLLLVGDTRMAVDFKKGGACCIVFQDDVAAGKGTLEWHVPPKALRSLGRRR